MATFRQLKSKRWQAIVRRKGVRQSRMFGTESDARKWAAMFEGSLDVRSAKEAGLLSFLPARIRLAFESAEHSPADIVLGSIPAPRGPGVYFLIRDGEVTYVGQTVDLFHRLMRHQRDGREFDGFNFLPCPKEKLDEIEAAYILVLNPRENKSIRLVA